MSNPERHPDQARSLEILGVKEREEKIYRFLLKRLNVTVAEAAGVLDMTHGKVQRLFDKIESKGLATHVPEHPRRYFPVAPDVALEVLALRRQEELRGARETIHDLLEESRRTQPREGREQMVELITSSEAARRTFDHLQESAQREVLCMVRPPMLASRLGTAPEEDQRTQRAAQSRGVRYRNIIDSEFLVVPDVLHAVREDVESGQNYRVVPNVPFKLLMADRRIAIIPLSLEHPGSPTLLVRSSALLDALHALFEILWKQAESIVFSKDGTLHDEDTRSNWPKDGRELTSLLAAGLNDKMIAHEMGISASTLNRRITELMKVLGARTRFQLGWLADRHLSDELEQQQAD